MNPNLLRISNEIEEKILSMYGLGLSYKDIIKHIEEIYQIELSTATISAITDKIIDKVKAWCWDAKNLASARIHTWPADA